MAHCVPNVSLQASKNIPLAVILVAGVLATLGLGFTVGKLGDVSLGTQSPAAFEQPQKCVMVRSTLTCISLNGLFWIHRAVEKSGQAYVWCSAVVSDLKFPAGRTVSPCFRIPVKPHSHPLQTNLSVSVLSSYFLRSSYRECRDFVPPRSR